MARFPTDLVRPVLDDNDLSALRTLRALNHEKPLVVCGHVVVATRDEAV